jgi:hypothetical protein
LSLLLLLLLLVVLKLMPLANSMAGREMDPLLLLLHPLPKLEVLKLIPSAAATSSVGREMVPSLLLLHRLQL